MATVEVDFHGSSWLKQENFFSKTCSFLSFLCLTGFVTSLLCYELIILCLELVFLAVITNFPVSTCWLSEVLVVKYQCATCCPADTRTHCFGLFEWAGLKEGLMELWSGVAVYFFFHSEIIKCIVSLFSHESVAGCPYSYLSRSIIFTFFLLYSIFPWINI